MPSDPTHNRRRTKLIASSVLAFGVACFLAGRLSIPRNQAGVVPLPPRIDHNRTIDTKSASEITEAIASPTNTPENWDEPRWRQLTSLPSSPSSTAARAAILEQLATTNPQQALALAQNEPNLMLRDNLLQAVLRGWARSAPLDAAHWALTQPLSSRETNLTAIFTGAVAANPAEAIRASRQLIEENPGEAVGYGGHVIDALCEAGDFRDATEFAASGGDGTRPFWMGQAYSKWASFQPQAAAQAASTITDPSTRANALHGVVGGWSMADPASLVKYVTQLPADAEKSSMVSQALQRWAKTNPVAAADWINNNEGGPEMDRGIASVATMEALKPDVAVGWAESISNPKIRSETLVSVLRNWATIDLAATKSYFEKSKDLLPEDRTEIVGLITTLSGQSTQP